jgi:antitoxin component HigA of HigAB toxin-antitoxin module
MNFFELIKMTGLKKKFLASEIGVSESMFSLQLKGKRKFKEEQKEKLKKILLKYLD